MPSPGSKKSPSGTKSPSGSPGSKKSPNGLNSQSKGSVRNPGQSASNAANRQAGIKLYNNVARIHLKSPPFELTTDKTVEGENLKFLLGKTAVFLGNNPLPYYHDDNLQPIDGRSQKYKVVSTLDQMFLMIAKSFQEKFCTHKDWGT